MECGLVLMVFDEQELVMGVEEAIDSNIGIEDILFVILANVVRMSGETLERQSSTMPPY